MNYKINKQLLSKPLKEEEKNVILEKLKVELKDIGNKLKKSPCCYRGCELWYDCKMCDGFMEGCSARLPELLFKDDQGRWRQDIP